MTTCIIYSGQILFSLYVPDKKMDVYRHLHGVKLSVGFID